MVAAIHHLHKRKRIYEKKEPYPHPEPWKRFLDKFICIIGILGPIFTIPQIFKIWVEKNAMGISLITWIAYLLGATCFMLYGISHKEKPLIIVYASLIVVDILVIIGVLLYG